MMRYANKILEYLQPPNHYKDIREGFWTTPILPILTNPNQGRWSEFVWHQGNSANNPYYDIPVGGDEFSKYRHHSGYGSVEITNQNKYSCHFTVYDILFRRNTSYTPTYILQDSTPMGLGAAYDDPYSNPFDAVSFPKFFNVKRVRKIILRPGESRKLNVTFYTLRKGQTVSPADYAFTSTYVQRFSQCVLIKCRGQLITDGDTTTEPENITMTPYFVGVRYSTDLVYRVLQNNTSVVEYTATYDNSLAGGYRKVAPGTLGVVDAV